MVNLLCSFCKDFRKIQTFTANFPWEQEKPEPGQNRVPAVERRHKKRSCRCAPPLDLPRLAQDSKRLENPVKVFAIISEVPDIV